MKRWLPFLLVLLLMLAANDLFAQGCSQCKMMSEQGSELSENSFGSNINTGILYLMILPYLMIMFLFRNRIINFFRSLSKR
jgi:hypothetical protein